MRSFRAKPTGWRGESHRHYLAAKGISTKQTANKYFMPLIALRIISLAALQRKRKKEIDRDEKYEIVQS